MQKAEGVGRRRGSQEMIKRRSENVMNEPTGRKRDDRCHKYN